jgi:hypothetical protein
VKYAADRVSSNPPRQQLSISKAMVSHSSRVIVHAPRDRELRCTHQRHRYPNQQQLLFRQTRSLTKTFANLRLQSNKQAGAQSKERGAYQAPDAMTFSKGKDIPTQRLRCRREMTLLIRRCALQTKTASLLANADLPNHSCGVTSFH